MSLAEELLKGICQPTPFLNTQFPFPVSQSFFQRDFHWDVLEDQIEEMDEARVVDHLELVLALAEGAEASQADREEHFISDSDLRRRVSRLDRDVGWALVWGDGVDGKSVDVLTLLKRKDFQTFAVAADPPARPDVTYLGARPTSVIYFVQCLVRYALTFGNIRLGDVHGISRFLNVHGPGVVFRLDVRPSSLDSALLQGMMFLGIPAVVLSAYPLPPVGARVADAPKDMVNEAMDAVKSRQLLVVK